MAHTLRPISELSAGYVDLLRRAKAAAAHSYCPYSQYNVGAALLHPDGTITVGTNWETCTHQSTCAERCAIVAANVGGKRTATAIAVYAYSAIPNTTDPSSVVTPCGLCRQMLHEVSHLSKKSLDIVVCTADMTLAAVSPLTAYLPNAFGPADMGVDIRKWSKL